MESSVDGAGKEGKPPLEQPSLASPHTVAFVFPLQQPTAVLDSAAGCFRDSTPELCVGTCESVRLYSCTAESELELVSCFRLPARLLALHLLRPPPL